MFVQVIHGKLADPELWLRQLDIWRDEIRPDAVGFLGSTGGVTADGRTITLARFSDAAAARANSERPEQGHWFEQSAKAFDGDPTFHDCSEVDQILDGGSNDAGFVQIMQGRAKDQQAMRSHGPAMEPELRTVRPDLIGGVIAWHDGEDGAFTQASYFTSEAEARRNEQVMASSPMFEQFRAMLDGDLAFYDLAPATLF